MCTIITLKDFCVYKVTTNLSNSTSKTKKFSTNDSKSNEKASEPLNPNDLLKTKNFFIEQQLFNVRPFISSNFVDFNIPNDTLFAHFFFSEFYFPESCNYPVPCPQFYANVSPVLINIDYLTLLWVNTVSLSIWREKLIVDEDNKSETNQILYQRIQKLQKSNNEEKKYRPNIHCDTCLDIVLPKINISIYSKTSEVDSRPCGIEVGFAKISVRNQSNANSSEFKATSEKIYQMSKDLCKKHTKFDAFTDSNSQKLFNKYNEIKLNQLAPCFKDYLKVILNLNLILFK